MIAKNKKKPAFKIIGLIFSLFLITIKITAPSFALEATSSAVSDSEVKEKIKERLEKVVETGIEKVKGIIDQENKNKLYAWTGFIKSISEINLSIDTSEGVKEAEIATDAAIFKVAPGKARQTIKANDLSVNQYIIIMGIKNSEEFLLGKRIIAADEKPATVRRRLISGKVIEVDEQKVTIKNNGDETSLTIDKKTKLKINGIKNPAAEDIQIDDHLAAIAVLDENEKIKSTSVILVIPTKSANSLETVEPSIASSASSTTETE